MVVQFRGLKVHVCTNSGMEEDAEKTICTEKRLHSFSQKQRKLEEGLVVGPFLLVIYNNG